MSQVIRYCRDCGRDQLFDQPHGGQECCPDVPDGDCPEWACTGCGAALFTGIPGRAGEVPRLRGRPGRVA